MPHPLFARSLGQQNALRQGAAPGKVPLHRVAPRSSAAIAGDRGRAAALRRAWWPGVLWVLTVLAACSPALDWRDVRLEPAQVRASLPCKPERMERPAELAGHGVDLHMLGCVADQSTFALACAELPEAAAPATVLTHWRAAVLASMGTAAAGAAGAKDVPFVLAGALELPQSVRTQARGSTQDGAPLHLQAVWFAQPQASRVSACHAIVFGPQPQIDAGQQFFESLVLR